MGVAIVLAPIARRSFSATQPTVSADAGAGTAQVALVAQAPVDHAPKPTWSAKELDLTKVSLDDRGATAPLPERRYAKLTLDPALQRTAVRLLTTSKIPEGAIVVLETATGRILAYASHLEQGTPRDLAIEATAPAASVFKIVTGAALVESAGLTADTQQCYSGGEQRIVASDLEANPHRDRWCATLSGAMGRSINTVFARLALGHLEPKSLDTMAHQLGFGETFAFDVPVQTSAVHVPPDSLGFARTAAGFWNTTLSPLHAAYLSAVVARGGEAVRPVIVDKVVEERGSTATPPSQSVNARRVLLQTTAEQLTTMMDHTVSEGTSFKAFHDPSGRAYIPGVPVAGKTGTLTDAAAQRYYTWFTGFAPSHGSVTASGSKPQVAIAVLVVNHPTWHVKANVVAREMLQAYFVEPKPRSAKKR